jgi:hypothetical protein
MPLEEFSRKDRCRVVGAGEMSPEGQVVGSDVAPDRESIRTCEDFSLTQTRPTTERAGTAPTPDFHGIECPLNKAPHIASHRCDRAK